MPVRPISEPTERSIPAVQITADMPSAMMPKKAKLRVMLKRLRSVRKASETKVITTPIARMATNTQKGWVRIAAWKPVISRWPVTLSSILAWPALVVSVMPVQSPP